MKHVFGAVCLVGLLAGCSTKSVDSTADLNAAKRKIASEMKVLSDQYSDARIYFCSEQVAMVTIDPAKCGQVRAKNPQAPCAEIAQYISPALKVVTKGTVFELVDEAKKITVFTVRAKRDSFQVYAQKTKESFLMKQYSLTEDDVNQLQYLPVCK